MGQELTLSIPPHSMRAWVCVFRPFSYTASVIPVLLGAVLAFYLGLSIRWGLFPLVAVASVLLQAGTNLVNEYFDYQKGVDRPETYGSSRVLVEQLLNPMHVLAAGLICFVLTAGIGLLFVALCGWPIFVIGGVGMMGGFFYTAGPAALKYWGLGDVLVFCLMGPLMVIGSFFVLTGGFDWQAVWVSLPVGFLVTGILSGNNLRDIADDREAKIHTAATLLGHRWARWEYAGLIAGAYAAVLIMAGFGALSWWSLLTLLTGPIAVKNIRTAMHSRVDERRAIVMLDVETAKLHLLFGLVLIGSLLLGVWL